MLYLYDYDTHHNTLLHSTQCVLSYDVDINGTGKTWLSFNLSIKFIRSHFLVVTVMASQSKSCEFVYHCWQDFFILLFSLCVPRSSEMKSTMINT